MRNLVSLVAVTTLFAIFLSTLPCLAIENEYTEDFTTTLYKDEVNTTARWDTALGELKLPPYVPTLVGTCDTPDAAKAVTISGDYAYIADGASGLQVIDISDPTSPVLAGSYNTPGSAYVVAISGDHAYVADAHGGLQVIDISDPTTPTLAGSYATVPYAFGVAVSGDYAYVANNAVGLLVIDISDPTTPVLAGTCDTPSAAHYVAISGDYAYVADFGSGLQVIDISDPTTPVIAGSCDTPDCAYVVAISGDHAYVADWTSGLQVIDISDPTTPVIAGSYDTPANACGIAISGDRAYIGDYVDGLQVIDISDPTDPVPMGSYDTPGGAQGVAVSGDHAYVADWTSGLQVIRIADPMLPPRAAGDSDVTGRMTALVIAGDYVYVSTGDLGVFDITDPTSPTLAGSYGMPGELYDIAIDGDYLCLAEGVSPGFRVLDISDPTNPLSAGTLSLPGQPRGVTVQSNYAYVSCVYTSQGFNVVDISDPTSPTLAGYMTGTELAASIAVHGNYAFCGLYSFYSVDISDPTTPTLAGSCTMPGGQVTAVAIAGDYAYVPCYTAGLQVMDIADPTAPTIVGSCAIPDLSRDIVVEGDYAYVSGYTSGLQVIDISDPLNPVLIGTYMPPGNAYNLAVAGDYAYVTDGSTTTFGLHVAEVFQGRLDVAGDTGQSLAIDDSEDSVLWAKLASTQANTISWELSADDGGAWESILPDDTWHQFVTPGTDLLWRSTHSYTTPGVNPACGDLQIKWLYDFGAVESIVDLPNDQGKQVRVSWAKSGHDYLGSSTPITEYAIYREIDGDLPLAGASDNPELGTKLYPPGDWVFLASVPACCEDEYAVVAPTVVDSTIAQGMYETTFFVRALTNTPGVHFDSPPDIGYSVDNIAPSPPQDILAANQTSGVVLNWTNPEEGETELEVWRAVWHTGDDVTSAYPEYNDDNPIEPVWPDDHAAAVASTEWIKVGPAWALDDFFIDDSLLRGIYYYVVYPADHAGNWGDGAQASSASYLLGDLTGVGGLPDGDVTLGDVSILGAAYGTSDGDGSGSYNNECDVGPTDDFSGSGIPETDNHVNFDDLMIFALNWDIEVTKTLPTEGSMIASFSWVKIDDTTWSLVLAEPCANLKGVNLQADLPQNAVLSLAAGSLLGQQDSPYFLRNIPRNGLDAGLALLGNGACITGQGELIRVKLAGEFDLDDILIVARDSDNKDLEYTIEGTTAGPGIPARYSLSANYPNPFNPSTKIDFDLPESQNVKLVIFGVDGRRIATLRNESMSAGRHTVTWTGRDDQDELVAAGIYFYRIQAGDFSETKKMMLIK